MADRGQAHPAAGRLGEEAPRAAAGQQCGQPMRRQARPHRTCKSQLTRPSPILWQFLTRMASATAASGAVRTPSQVGNRSLSVSKARPDVASVVFWLSSVRTTLSSTLRRSSQPTCGPWCRTAEGQPCIAASRSATSCSGPESGGRGGLAEVIARASVGQRGRRRATSSGWRRGRLPGGQPVAASGSRSPCMLPRLELRVRGRAPGMSEQHGHSLIRVVPP